MTSPYPFVPARHFTPASRGVGDIDLVVIHTAETLERSDSAEGTARYFQTTDRDVSSHYTVDADSIVQCVREKDVAWCAPGANHDGIHLELAGRAAQTPAEWGDDYSRRLLRRAARLTAGLVDRYRIPIRFVGPSGLVAGEKGITTHAAVSRAFRRSDHWDPGAGFPMQTVFLPLVRELAALPEAPSPTPSPTSSSRPTLRLGSTGWQVKRAQRMLNAVGIVKPALEVDGVFGLRTKAAVVSFQAAHGLDADGIVGPATWPALELEAAR